MEKEDGMKSFSVLKNCIVTDWPSSLNINIVTIRVIDESARLSYQ
jgi:hypothetical protein